MAIVADSVPSGHTHTVPIKPYIRARTPKGTLSHSSSGVGMRGRESSLSLYPHHHHRTILNGSYNSSADHRGEQSVTHLGISYFRDEAELRHGLQNGIVLVKLQADSLSEHGV